MENLEPVCAVCSVAIARESFYLRLNKIPPIKLTPYSTCISQYADDTTIITFARDQILKKIFYILEQYRIISGLKINETKTQIL